jgi:NADH-quinone oxidoreductase subunit K
MIVPFGHVLVLAALLFLLGACCAVARRQLLMILIGVEIMLNAAALAFVAAALHWGRAEGQIFALFIIGVAAAEVAVGLALIVAARQRTGSTRADDFNRLRG